MPAVCQFVYMFLCKRLRAEYVCMNSVSKHGNTSLVMCSCFACLLQVSVAQFLFMVLIAIVGRIDQYVLS
jgi:hypothetical protein